MSAATVVTTRRQRTISRPEEFSGIGIHTGQEVRVRMCPAQPGEGIYFKRVDLPGRPVIPARIEYVFDTMRSTNIGLQDVKIYTVEHLLAAVKAFELDNLCIEISGIEPPAGNGSSDVFFDMIERAGVHEQDATISVLGLQKCVHFSEGETHLIAMPSDSYRISYTLHYPHSKVLGTQYQTVQITAENFKKEIAPCRTFALYAELSHLIDRGLIKGASLDNAVVINDDSVLSKGGLFFPNEMARHKILDIVGDLSLVGIPFVAHIVAIKSGHPSNFQLAKRLFNYFSMENN